MVATSTEHAPPAVPAAGRDGWFRGDVDGLRAIAIVLVVAYHAGLAGFHGGFVGVDVFFVISGFLISRNLLKESETKGRISLGTFWARRVRRLVPALGLVVAVTLVASYFVVPLYDLDTVTRQGGAAVLYVSNILFASQAKDYFAADVSTSPFLHTWSLGVEEQFYLVWPWIFAGACLLVAGSRRAGALARRRALLVAAFAATFAASLALDVALTRSGSTWAFFGLPARAWEFAIAGLLAAVPVPRVLRHVAARTVLAVAGLALLVVALVVIDDATPYPGLWALIPVSATVLLILAGERWGGEVRPTPFSAVLATAPMQWLGRVSYSWYLWHWPAIVLTAIALDRNAVPVKAAAALATLPVAWAAYRFFETPLRFAPPIARSLPRTFAFGAAVTGVVLAIVVVIRPATPSISQADTVDVASLEAPPGSSLQERVSVAVAQYRKRSDDSCPKDALQTSSGDDYCVGGDLSSDTSVMLLGDSHAGQWRRPLEEVAKAKGLKLLIRQHNGCPPYDVPVTDPKKGETKTEICDKQQAGDLRVIDELRPSAIIVATWSGNQANIVDRSGDKPDAAEQVQMWETGVRERLTAIRDRGIRIGMILDEPTLPQDASKCIASKNSITACESDRATALAKSAPLLTVERQVVAELGDVPALDMTDLVCDAARCKLEIDGTLVYVDAHHFTDAFAAKQVPLLRGLMDRLVP